MGVVVTVGELKPSSSLSSGKKYFRHSSSARHVAEWPISDVSSDLTIVVETTSFALHKFPLVSRSGKIKKLLLEDKESKFSRLHLNGVPGGAEAFDLATKFCYGVNIEINLSNVAMLYCVSHFLEMTQEFSENNLGSRTEVYLKEDVFSNISSSISVLHCCENLLPVAEDVDLIKRLINAISRNSCKQIPSSDTEESSDWWGKSLAMLNIELFQRVLTAFKDLKPEIITRILIDYAQTSLQGRVEKQRITVETIVSLLPNQSRKSAVLVPMPFLSSLLKSSISVTASTSCISDLEKRIGMQLDQAILEDILIPANSDKKHQSLLYDIDTVLSMLSSFMNLDEVDEDGNPMVHDFNSHGSPKHSSILKVSELLDNYLAEVAVDSNLNVSKFIQLLELLPDHARLVYDGLYRAVDIFLKVHQNMKDSERHQLCKTINCHKLSQEACTHAAQNERLPLQISVQVLYFEQIRLRNAMNGNNNSQFYLRSSSSNQHFSQRCGSTTGSGCVSPRDNYASVRRENRELKLDVARMRMRLTDLEKDHVFMKQEMVRPKPINGLFKFLTEKLSKVNSFFKFVDFKVVREKGHSETWFSFQKRRCNSVS